MHFLFPERRALCMAENATHNLHNLRHAARRAGARPARLGAVPQRGDRAVRRRAPTSLFASHHWPTWGARPTSSSSSRCSATCTRYLHDQTLRLLNQGHTGIEIAEEFELPPALEAAWHTAATTARSATT